jgi:sulfur carrier protein
MTPSSVICVSTTATEVPPVERACVAELAASLGVEARRGQDERSATVERGEGCARGLEGELERVVPVKLLGGHDRRDSIGRMEVTVNGEARSVPDGVTVRGLLEHLGLTDGPVAVEVNRAVVPRAQHATHLLSGGDAIEVVHLVGGG